MADTTTGMDDELLLLRAIRYELNPNPRFLTFSTAQHLRSPPAPFPHSLSRTHVMEFGIPCANLTWEVVDRHDHIEGAFILSFADNSICAFTMAYCTCCADDH